MPITVTTLPFTLPPIVERELRVTSRRSATYWSRAGAAISGIIIVCWVMTAQLAMGPATMAGQITFRLLASIAAFTAVIGVLQLSSDAFAREKREDTIGFLFLTPLKPVDLALGKLVSTSLAAFYRFLAMVPLLALPVLMGGVTASNFVLLVLGLINGVFLGATIGLYVSARSWDEKRAGGVATLAMICLTLLPAFAMPLAALMRQSGVASLFAISPAYPIWHATFPGTARSGLFWASLLWGQILGWTFFFATCRTLPRCWQNRPITLSPIAEHLHGRGGDEEQRSDTANVSRISGPARTATVQNARRAVWRQFSAQQRTRMLEQNPIFWLAMRWKPAFTTAWIVGALGLVAVAVIFIAGQPRELISPPVALFICFCVNAGFKLSASTYASNAFARDSGEDRLQLLLSTPITPRDMIHGHALALRETLRPWIRRVLWIEASWLVFTFVINADRMVKGMFTCALASVAVLTLLVPDLHAVGWAALWRGVTARKSREAEQEANQQVLVLPWILCALVWVIVQVMADFFSAAIAMILAWIAFSAAADWWFGKRAREKLETRLLLWAQRRAAGEFEQYDGWRRGGRWLGHWWMSQRKRIH